MRLDPIVFQHPAEVGWVKNKDVEGRNGRHTASSLASLLGAHVTLVMAMMLLRAGLELGHLVCENS